MYKQKKRLLKVKNFMKNTPSKSYHIQKNAKSKNCFEKHSIQVISYTQM